MAEYYGLWAGMNCTSEDGKTVLYNYGFRTSIKLSTKKVGRNIVVLSIINVKSWSFGNILKYNASYKLNLNLTERY